MRLITCFLILFTTSLFAVEEEFLLINAATGETVMELGSRIDERVSPCSSFKIVLSLMGFDAGVLHDENSPVWDFCEGYDDFLSSWKVSHSPKSWMQHSCVWYSKLLSMELGQEKMQRYLDAFDYGNKDMSGGIVPPGKIDPPWINSSIKISPREQVAFIQKLVRRELPISESALESTRAIVFKEESPEGWRLYGKLGYSSTDVPEEFSWFVGWLEKEEQHFPFAYLIRAKNIRLEKRVPRVKQFLAETSLFKGQG